MNLRKDTCNCHSSFEVWKRRGRLCRWKQGIKPSSKISTSSIKQLLLLSIVDGCFSTKKNTHVPRPTRAPLAPHPHLDFKALASHKRRWSYIRCQRRPPHKCIDCIAILKTRFSQSGCSAQHLRVPTSATRAGQGAGMKVSFLMESDVINLQHSNHYKAGGPSCGFVHKLWKSPAKDYSFRMSVYSSKPSVQAGQTDYFVHLFPKSASSCVKRYKRKLT